MEKIQVLTIKDAHGATWTVPESHVSHKGKRANWFGRTCRVIRSDRWFIAELLRALTKEEVQELHRAVVSDFAIMDTLDGRESFIMFENRHVFDRLKHLTKSQPINLSTGGGKVNR
jgi:hypothetical protein